MKTSLSSFIYQTIDQDGGQTNYSTDDAIEYLETYKKNEQADFWILNLPPERAVEFSYTAKKTSKIKPQKDFDWLALVPGDIIYYRGAFGLKSAIHWGIYVGNGYVIERWRNEKNYKKGDIVLNSVALFGTDKSYVLSWNNRHFLNSCFNLQKKAEGLLKQEVNRYRYIYKAQNSRVKLQNLRESLVRVGEQDRYHLLTQSCSHFVSEVIRGYKTKNFITPFLQTIDILLQKKHPKQLRFL